MTDSPTTPAEAITAIDTACRHFARLLEHLRTAEAVDARVLPADRFARLPGDFPGQAGDWAFPFGDTVCSLTPVEVDLAVDLAQQQLLTVATLLASWRTDTGADPHTGSAREGDTPLEALARADARMDQIRGGVSVLRSPYVGLYLPVGDDYLDADWADECEDLGRAAPHLGTALLDLAMGNPRRAAFQADRTRSLLDACPA
ncbi:hypothetical protein ACFVZ3_12450 [Kitasatospora purpeofusca]|uniref:hypothetical protein n=1 Tax=Kitasatospora purpeofusca TaxID=67352 RepID=UPI0036A90A0A